MVENPHQALGLAVELLLLIGAFCAGVARQWVDGSLLGLRSSDADGWGKETGNRVLGTVSEPESMDQQLWVTSP